MVVRYTLGSFIKSEIAKSPSEPVTNVGLLEKLNCDALALTK